MEKTSTFINALVGAVTAPDRTFDRDRTVSISRFALFFMIIILTLSGSYLSMRFHRNETMQTLTMIEMENRIQRMMASAPEEAREQARARIAESTAGSGSLFQMIFGTFFPALLRVLFVFEVWFLAILLMQFMGGEEVPLHEKKHRRSLYLSLYAVVPLAVQDLVRGIVLSFKDPEKAGNVLTIAEYQERTEISLSLLEIFRLPALPDFIDFMLYTVTNPFVLWSFAIALFGGRSVFRIQTGKMAIAIAIVFAVIGLQNQFFNMFQGTFGG